MALVLALVLGLNFESVSVLATTETAEQVLCEISRVEENETEIETENEAEIPVQTEIGVNIVSGNDLSYEVLPSAEPSADNNSNTGVNRYTVLLLDTENSFNMTNNWQIIYKVETPLNVIKKAANKFIEQVQSANGTNHVAIVTYSSKAIITSEFSTDTEALKKAVNNISKGNTFANINDAFVKADELLDAVEDENAIKNVVLFTQGVNGAGSYKSSGRYTVDDCTWVRTDTGVHIYEYSNATYATAKSMMDKYNLYSIGLFQSFNSVPEKGRSLLEFAIRFSKDLQNKGFQTVDNVDNLEFAFGEVAEDIIAEPGKFKYAGMYNSKDDKLDTEAEYWYTDNYFRKDSTVYNPSLATMSLCFELSSWSSHEVDKWDDKSKNAKNLLLGCDTDKGIGFKDFAQNEFWSSAPTTESIGVVAAQKEIKDAGKDYTLIAVAVRGGGYGSEWGSNFTLGATDDHAGFAQARENVLSFLKNYVSEYVIGEDNTEVKNIKLWIVGYSRAGAVANMVAGKLNNNPNYLSDRTNLEQKNLFCYTFEAPQGVYGANNTAVHNNIHNVMNLNDLVPLVAPTAWKFSRYGKTKTFSTLADADFIVNLEAMKKELEKMGFDPKTKYTIIEGVTLLDFRIDVTKILPGGHPLWWWEEHVSSPTQVILVKGVDFLANDAIGSRAFYNEKLEKSVKELIGTLMHYDGAGAGFSAKLLTIFDKENLINILKPMLSENPFYSYEERLIDVQKNLFDIVSSICEEYAVGNLAEGLCVVIFNVITEIAKDIFNGSYDSLELIQQMYIVFDESGFTAHYPEITLAWARSEDPHYNENISQETGANSTVIRILRINCPVDVTVKDDAGSVVASIINDVAQENNDGIIAGVNENDEKIVYLPGDAEYTVDIAATDNGNVSISLSEYDFLYGKTTRLMNYYDIPIQTGDVLTSIVPAVKDEELENSDIDGSTTEYQLLDENSSVIVCDEEFAGADKASETYEVSIIREGNGGSVEGAGNFNRGSYAKLEAQLLPNAEFLGWYKDGELLSKELSYRFAVKENTNIVAKFNTVDFYTLNANDTVGGVVVCPENYYAPGVEISITAIADEGYVFERWHSDEVEFADETAVNTTFSMPSENAIVTAYFRKEGQNTDTKLVGFTWGNDNSSCVATFSVGDKEQVVDCTVTSQITEATENMGGKIVYTATVEFGGQTYTDTKTVTIPALETTEPTEPTEPESKDPKPSEEKEESKGNETKEITQLISPLTGDSGNIIILLVALGSLAILITLFYKRKQL